MFSDLDPSRVCKGKGVVTLRATLVHIDDEDCISDEPNVISTPSKSGQLPQLFRNSAPHDEENIKRLARITWPRVCGGGGPGAHPCKMWTEDVSLAVI